VAGFMTKTSGIHIRPLLEEFAVPFINRNEPVVIRRETGKEGSVFRLFDVFPKSGDFQEVDKEICVYRRSMLVRMTLAKKPVTRERNVIDYCM
jgi:hypothetical protein